MLRMPTGGGSRTTLATQTEPGMAGDMTHHQAEATPAA